MFKDVHNDIYMTAGSFEDGHFRATSQSQTNKRTNHATVKLDQKYILKAKVKYIDLLTVREHLLFRSYQNIQYYDQRSDRINKIQHSRKFANDICTVFDYK